MVTTAMKVKMMANAMPAIAPLVSKATEERGGRGGRERRGEGRERGGREEGRGGEGERGEGRGGGGREEGRRGG